ncbi:xanthine phosphoribosyltransferase [Candidatus Dependentiae bacterium]|nr:xanthine phosphoribosyltransferase [Candidatus Dependentiae bacterium]
MDLLKKMILEQGQVIEDGEILKVDSFIDHQIDTGLMKKIAEEFIVHFKELGIINKITKIITIEASGIAVAVVVGMFIERPIIFARKKIPITLIEKLYSRTIISPTKNDKVELVISSKYLGKEDKVFIIDDFLATGTTSIALIEMIKESGAEVLGTGAIIENFFQGGREKIHKKFPDLEIFSLVSIESMNSSGEIIFK